MPQFLILANDYTDAEALNRRMAVREEHLARMRIEKAKGNFIIGGARLNNNQMIGSMLVVELPAIEAVHEWLSIDPYVKDKVWENYEVIPFKIAEV